MDREQRSHSPVMMWVVILLLIPVLYLVSSGPVEWLMVRGYISYDNPVVDAFYYPGERLMEMCPPLNEFVRRRLSFWK